MCTCIILQSLRGNKLERSCGFMCNYLLAQTAIESANFGTERNAENYTYNIAHAGVYTTHETVA